MAPERSSVGARSHGASVPRRHPRRMVAGPIEMAKAGDVTVTVRAIDKVTPVLRRIRRQFGPSLAEVVFWAFVGAAFGSFIGSLLFWLVMRWVYQG